jgi:mannose-6-phosphate isomerase
MPAGVSVGTPAEHRAILATRATPTATTWRGLTARAWGGVLPGMERLLALDNSIQRYAWGSPDAIPAILGQATSAGEAPWAELWMGAHSSAPSRVQLAPGHAIALDEIVARQAQEILGARVASAFGGRLPFLFKLIAAARPLSIQCHPDAAAARAGFERENRLGVPIGARERNYRDPSHKPELLVALGRFEALVGFRPPREIGERLEAAGARELAAEIDGLELPGGLTSFVAALLRLPRERRRALLEQVSSGLAGDTGREADWVRRLMVEHPGDPAALAPLFLNLIELGADEGLYLGAGVLHAYLGGVGLELMASSDNVLRGGLTEKHIDIDELCAVMRGEAMQPAVLTPARAADGLDGYTTPAAEFRLGFLDVSPAGHERVGSGGPEILLSFAERCRLVDGETGAALDLRRGGSALVTAQATTYRVEGEGGRVYIASVP